MEKFYEEWTLPVKTWALSYSVSIIYSIVMVYFLLKMSTADERHPGLFDHIMPSKEKNEAISEAKSPVPVITQLKSYCGSTGTVSHKQVEHYEDESKGELLLQQ